MSRKEGRKISLEDMMKLLDVSYAKSISGIPRVSAPVETIAARYLEQYPDTETAAKAMLKKQISKCAASGFITGFGGLITIPVSIPANLGSVLYMHIRMIACAAHMGGYDLHSDEVRTYVYACLAGVSVKEVFKEFGWKIGEVTLEAGIEKIPAKILVKINERLGFKMLAKFGEEGVVSLGKLIPGVGAVINGTWDYMEAKHIASRAYKMFIKGDFSVGGEDGLPAPEGEVSSDQEAEQKETENE